MARWTAGLLDLMKGDWTRARPRIEAGIAALRTADAVLALPWALASAAWVLAQLGEADEALDLFRESERLVEDLAARDLVGAAVLCYSTLGRAGLLLGRVDEAQSLGDRAVESLPRPSGAVAHARCLLGDVATHSGRFDAESGQDHYRKALALAEPQGMRPLVADCHLGLGKVYRRIGKSQQAREHLLTAATMYRAMDMRFWLEQAEAEMA